ncbi:hypothetical protein [Labilibaculum sp.]|uniref:hypothetical protein n=1 Tax=Labilibaculum sp. TaxID=2060723 RepID=UPI002AA75151|nr:hypothetical protein [Labilibaculum sp.]
MARMISEIKSEMTEAFIADATIIETYGLDESKTFDQQFSKVSLESIFFYIVAVSAWVLETLFDLHKAEVDETLETLMPHTARWYRNKAVAFQYGFDLLEDSDEFDNTGYTDEQVETAKIVKYSAVVESEVESRLIVKIATEAGSGELTPVTTEQFSAFIGYMAEVKDAGVRVTVINYLPDRLKLSLRIVRDPLVLDANGMHLINANYPVNEAIQTFMKELPFNGKLSLQSLVDKLQTADGVSDLSLDLARTAWIDADNYGDWSDINISTIPISGYFYVNLDNDTEPETLSDINYV